MAVYIIIIINTTKTVVIKNTPENDPLFYKPFKTAFTTTFTTFTMKCLNKKIKSVYRKWYIA